MTRILSKILSKLSKRSGKKSKKGLSDEDREILRTMAKAVELKVMNLALMRKEEGIFNKGKMRKEEGISIVRQRLAEATVDKKEEYGLADHRISYNKNEGIEGFHLISIYKTLPPQIMENTRVFLESLGFKMFSDSQREEALDYEKSESWLSALYEGSNIYVHAISGVISPRIKEMPMSLSPFALYHVDAEHIDRLPTETRERVEDWLYKLKNSQKG